MRIEPTTLVEQQHNPPTSRPFLNNPPPSSLFFSTSSLHISSINGWKTIGYNILSLLTAVIKWIKKIFKSKIESIPPISPKPKELAPNHLDQKEPENSLFPLINSLPIEKESPTSSLHSIPMLTSEEKATLNFIIKTLAHDGTAKIAFQYLKLLRMKNSAKSIHPLRFLEYALEASRRSDLQKLANRKDFKIGELFREELIERLKSCANENFPIHLQGFIKTLENEYQLIKDYNLVKDLLAENKWNDLLNYLIY